MNQDAHHLYLLTIFHYILAGLTALCAGGFLLLFPLGAFLSQLPPSPGQSAMPPEVTMLFFGIGAVAFALTLAYAAALFFAGRYLARRRGYAFCMVVAVLNCLNAPLGLALGVFTLIVLSRSSVRALFPGGPAAAQAAG